MRYFLRASVALVMVTAIVTFLGLPLCLSEACPMTGEQRAACRSMGRECCGTKGGQVSHTPELSAPVLATATELLALGPPAAPESAAVADPSRTTAAPAIVQGVGLFTLFAVFLI